MGSEQSVDTERIARAYFNSWTAKDTAAAASTLADEFTFTAGDMRIEGREAFLDAAAFPENATTKMVAEAYQGENAFQMYDAMTGDGSVRIVEHLIVRDGAIQSSAFVTDVNAYMSLMAR